MGAKRDPRRKGNPTPAETDRNGAGGDYPPPGGKFEESRQLDHRGKPGTAGTQNSRRFDHSGLPRWRPQETRISTMAVGPVRSDCMLSGSFSGLVHPARLLQRTTQLALEKECPNRARPSKQKMPLGGRRLPAAESKSGPERTLSTPVKYHEKRGDQAKPVNKFRYPLRFRITYIVTSDKPWPIWRNRLGFPQNGAR